MVRTHTLDPTLDFPSPKNPFPFDYLKKNNAILAIKAVIATERKNGSLKKLVDAEILLDIVQTDP